MRNALIISTIATLAALAQPAAAESKFGGKVTIRESLVEYGSRITVDRPDSSDFTIGGDYSPGAIFARCKHLSVQIEINRYFSTLEDNIADATGRRVRSCGRSGIDVAIGQNVKNYDRIGGIDNK